MFLQEAPFVAKTIPSNHFFPRGPGGLPPLVLPANVYSKGLALSGPLSFQSTTCTASFLFPETHACACIASFFYKSMALRRHKELVHWQASCGPEVVLSP